MLLNNLVIMDSISENMFLKHPKYFRKMEHVVD